MYENGGRPSDSGFVAENENGHELGAIWLRLLIGDEQSSQLVQLDDDVSDLNFTASTERTRRS